MQFNLGLLQLEPRRELGDLLSKQPVFLLHLQENTTVDVCLLSTSVSPNKYLL
jgi:hypothetical protein